MVDALCPREGQGQEEKEEDRQINKKEACLCVPPLAMLYYAILVKTNLIKLVNPIAKNNINK